MAQKTVSIEGLSNAAKTYDPLLRALPFLKFNDISKSLRIRILEIEGEHILVNKRRRAGLLAPYTPGKTQAYDKEIMKFVEMKIKPERTYADLRDNVTNYDDVKIISNNGNFADNKTKKHPLELTIVQDIVTTYSEDVLYSMFFAERDPNVLSPMTAFTGFNPKIDILRAGGYISTDEKNLITTDEIKAPTSTTDTKPYDQVVAFVAAAHPILRAGNTYLYISEGTLLNARAGYKNKTKAFNDPTTAEMLERLKDDARCPRLVVLTDPALGIGSRMMLTGDNILDFATGKAQDSQYVLVRPIGEDPNDVQFWIQASYDTRINDVHRKVFQVNEQANTALDLAGDYK